MALGLILFWAGGWTGWPTEVLFNLNFSLILKAISFLLLKERKGKGLTNDFGALIFWQLWNSILIFNYAFFITCIHTHMQDIFWFVLLQQTSRMKLVEYSSIMAHEGTKDKAKSLWKGGCSKAHGILASQVAGRQDYGRRLKEIMRGCNRIILKLFCVHLCWSNRNCST